MRGVSLPCNDVVELEGNFFTSLMSSMHTHKSILSGMPSAYPWEILPPPLPEELLGIRSPDWSKINQRWICCLAVPEPVRCGKPPSTSKPKNKSLRLNTRTCWQFQFRWSSYYSNLQSIRLMQWTNDEQQSNSLRCDVSLVKSSWRYPSNRLYDLDRLTGPNGGDKFCPSLEMLECFLRRIIFEYHKRVLSCCLF